MIQVSAGGRTFVKTRYFFKAGELPHNYHQVACMPARLPACLCLSLADLPLACFLVPFACLSLTCCWLFAALLLAWLVVGLLACFACLPACLPVCCMLCPLADWLPCLFHCWGIILAAETASKACSDVQLLVVSMSACSHVLDCAPARPTQLRTRCCRV